MIIFQALDKWELDLTDHGLSLHENSNRFTNEINKSYSFPFKMDMDENLMSKFGLVNLENISDYNLKIEGYLILDEGYFDAYIAVNEVLGDNVEMTLFYGEEILSVFDKNLSELPFPVIDTAGDLLVFAKSQLIKSYPEATHNFPKVYRPQIKQNANYENFEFFINHFDKTANIFKSNYSGSVDGNPVPFNRNVMVPCPYLMEILRIGFKTEGKELRGDFANSDFFKKVVLIPKQILELFSAPNIRTSWQFEFYDSQESIDNKTINVYEKTFTPAAEGTYTLKYKLDFQKGIAEYFDLKITYGAKTLFSAEAINEALILDDIININLVDIQNFEDIKVVLKISQQHNTIANSNRFDYDLIEGNINTFPETYSLSDFMPDMTFREFFNAIKDWANLDETYLKNAVYLNFLDNEVQQLSMDDHSHLEVKYPKRKLNKNNLFKLTYADGQQVLVNKKGQIYSETEYVDNEIEEIPFNVLPLLVTSNEGTVTGSYPDAGTEIVVGLYNGLVANEPIIADNFNDQTLLLQDMYLYFHKIWLSFRANSEQYKDSYFAHISEKFNLKSAIFKYNKIHLIKNLKKTRINDQWWKIDTETESF